MPGDKISIVIPTYNRLDKLKRLLDSIMQSDQKGIELEVIVVDDAGPNDTEKELSKKYPNVKVIKHETEKYLAASRNTGIKAAKGDYIFCVDDDNVLDEECIVNLVKGFGISKKVGMTVPYMLYLSMPDTIWSAGAKISKRLMTPLCKSNEKYTPEPSFIICDTAPNAFMFKKEVIKKVGLFDEIAFPMHHLEADYGLRLRNAKYMSVAIANAITYHDIAFEKRFDLEFRHRKRPYNMMFGEVMLRRKWEENAFWRYAMPMLILGATCAMILRSSHVYGSKPDYIMQAFRGYIDAWTRRIK